MGDIDKMNKNDISSTSRSFLDFSACFPIASIDRAPEGDNIEADSNDRVPEGDCVEVDSSDQAPEESFSSDRAPEGSSDEFYSSDRAPEESTEDFNSSDRVEEGSTEEEEEDDSEESESEHRGWFHCLSSRFDGTSWLPINVDPDVPFYSVKL